METYKPARVKIDEKEMKKIFKEFDDLNLRSGNYKTAFRAGSNPMLGCLPKAAAIFSAYPIAPMSPTSPRDYASRANRAGARSPMSIIPKEAMETKKDDSFKPLEPTSPKVSCIGQVKKKKKACKEKHRRRRVRDEDPDRDRSLLPSRPVDLKMSKVKRYFSGKTAAEPEEKDHPKLGDLKRFPSGRECPALANVFRDSEKLGEKCCEVKDVVVPASMVFFSGSLMIEAGDLRPKAERNLWKRRLPRG